MIGDGIGGSNYISRMQFCLCLMLAWLFASHWKTLIARYEGAINGHCQTQCVLWYHIYCEVKREGCDGQGGGVALSLCLQHWYPTFVSHFIKSAKDEIFSQTPEVQGLTVGGCRTPHTAHAQVHTIATPECLCVCLCVYVCVCVCVCVFMLTKDTKICCSAHSDTVLCWIDKWKKEIQINPQHTAVVFTVTCKPTWSRTSSVCLTQTIRRNLKKSAFFLAFNGHDKCVWNLFLTQSIN